MGNDAYCCGEYDTSTQLCENGKAPWTMPGAYLLFPNTSTPLDEYAKSLNQAVDTNITDVSSSDAYVSKADASHNGMTIGVATGVSLGALLLFTALLLCWEWRTASRLKRELDKLRAQLLVDDSSQQTGLVQQATRFDDRKAVQLWEGHQLSEMPPKMERQELDGVR